MSEIDTVRALNAIFRDFDFSALRDSIEVSDPDEVSSGIDRVNELVRDSIVADVVIEFHGEAGLPEGRRYEGLAEYLRFWRGWLAAFGSYEIEHRNYEQVGECVVVSVIHHGRGRGSGLDVTIPQGQLWRFRDGRVAEIHVYDTVEDARADLPSDAG